MSRTAYVKEAIIVVNFTIKRKEESISLTRRWATIDLNAPGV